jgi:hypothetical protein
VPQLRSQDSRVHRRNAVRQKGAISGLLSASEYTGNQVFVLKAPKTPEYHIHKRLDDLVAELSQLRKVFSKIKNRCVHDSVIDYSSGSRTSTDK